MKIELKVTDKVALNNSRHDDTRKRRTKKTINIKNRKNKMIKTKAKPTQLEKAIRIYKQWIDYWPTERKDALEIAYSFLDTTKERIIFDKWKSENEKS